MLIIKDSVFRALAITFLSLFSSVCFSQAGFQNENNGIILTGSGGIMLAKIKDQQFSTVLYSGHSPIAMLSLGYQINKHLHELAFSFAKGNLTNDQAHNYTLNLQRITVQYTFGAEVGITSNQRWTNYLGASFGYLGNKKDYTGFINKSSSGEKNYSLGCMLQSGYRFGENEQWALLARLTLPVVSYVVQDDPGINQDESAKLVFIPKLFILNTALQLERKIGQNSAVLLKYQWDAYKLGGHLPVMQAAHNISLSYQVKL
jgi:hypothetical protein